MKCPRCKNELRQSKKDPNYGLCDNCKKKYKWIDEHKDDEYEEDEELEDDDNDEDELEDDDNEHEDDDNAHAKSRSRTPKKKSKGRKALIIIFALVAVLLLGAAVFFFLKGNPFENANNTANEETQEDADREYVDDVSAVAASPEEYEGKWVSFTGKVLSFESDTDGVYLQVYTDPQNYGGNVVVHSTDTSLTFFTDDYVFVEGKVEGIFARENMSGEELNLAKINATTIEGADYISAMSPTIAEIFPAASMEQHGFTLTVEAVEFAETETRVYVTAINNTGEEYALYTYSMAIIQNGHQFEIQNNYDANYEALPSDIPDTILASGIVSFPALDATTPFQLIAEGQSNNWELEFVPFTIDITP